MIKKLLFIVVLLGIGELAISQNIKKAFKALDDNNYTSARIIFTDAIENAETKAIGEYGMAVVYRNTSLRIEDMYRAFESISSSKKDYRSCSDKIKKKYKSYVNSDIIEKESILIDELLFVQVKSKDDVSAYQKHIDLCETSKFHSQIIDLRNAKAYNIAVGYNTISSYSDFCDKYPDSKEYAQAKTIMYTMAWTKCQTKGKKKDYQEFINDYPNAPQIILAKDKLRKLEYNEALSKNTTVAFNSFIAKYPDSEEAKELKGEGAKSEYKKAEMFKSINVCESFLIRYPNSDYTARVTVIRDSLAYEAVIEKNTTEDYNLFIEKYPNAIQVPLVMAKMGNLIYTQEELQNIRAKFAIAQKNIENIKIYNSYGGASIMQEKKFDIYGNCIYNFEQLLSDYSELSKSYFDESGDKLIKEELYVNNKIKTIANYTYDDKALISSVSTECKFNCIDNAENYVDSFSYDQNRNILSIKRYSNTAKLIESHIYTYNSKGYRITEVYKKISGDDYKTYNNTYSYNGKGYLIQKKVENEIGKTIEVESTSYDNLDNKTSYSRYDARGTQTITYVYNKKGIVDHEIVKYKHDESIEDTRNWKYIIRESDNNNRSK